jgi:hypothetical protein
MVLKSSSKTILTLMSRIGGSFGRPKPLKDESLP